MTTEDSARRCRVLASEVRTFAITVESPAMREGYSALAKRWSDMANELDSRASAKS